MPEWENGCIVDITQEEEAIKAALEDYKKRELKRPLEPHEVFNLLAKNIVNLVEIDDDTSLRMKDHYPIFNEIIGKVVDAGFKFTYKDDLWKVRQKHTPQEIYPPSIDTASLYERIDEKHAGTIDDPISSTTQCKFLKAFITYIKMLFINLSVTAVCLYTLPLTV